MKKILILLAAIVLINSASPAQELGIRYGEVTAGKWAVDGVFSIGSLKRVHADLSFDKAMGLDALWDFLYGRIKGEAFNYYFGVGAFIFFKARDDNKEEDAEFKFGALGEAGLEYRFNKIPIVIGIDWRPSFQIIDKTNLSFGGFGLNARFVF